MLAGTVNPGGAPISGRRPLVSQAPEVIDHVFFPEETEFLLILDQLS